MIFLVSKFFNREGILDEFLFWLKVLKKYLISNKFKYFDYMNVNY